MFGSPLEVEKNGMLRAVFDEEGKLEDLEMMFDGVAVHQQLLRALEVRGGGESRKKSKWKMENTQNTTRAFCTLSV